MKRPTEADHQRTFLQMARHLGWRSLVVNRVRVSGRGGCYYATPFGGDGAGWPDTLLVHEERGQMLAVELKADGGRLRPEQVLWHRALRACGVDVRVWKLPRDWTEAERALKGEG